MMNDEYNDNEINNFFDLLAFFEHSDFDFFFYYDKQKIT